jgi:presenilin 1
MEVLQALDIPIDIITFSFVVYNFSIVGVLVTFFWPAPLLMKQAYLIFIGTVVGLALPGVRLVAWMDHTGCHIN